MRIVHVTDALSAYIDGELPPNERAQVERHLETCEDCRRRLAGLRTVVTLVRSSEPISAPEGFRAHVRARVEQMGHGQTTRRWSVIPLSWRLIGAAAAVAIIGIFAVSLVRTERPVAMREIDAQNEGRLAAPQRERSSADKMRSEAPAAQRSSEAPTAPEFGKRPTPAQRPRTVQRLIVLALPAMALGALAWMVVRRRRRQRTG